MKEENDTFWDQLDTKFHRMRRKAIKILHTQIHFSILLHKAHTQAQAHIFSLQKREIRWHITGTYSIGETNLKKRKDVYEMEEEKQGFICGNEKLQ